MVVLEDVITTGGSTLKAVEKLGQAGVKVVGVVALVDRLEGGAEAIEAAGLPLVSIARGATSFPTDRGSVTHTGAKDRNSFTKWR